MGVNGGARPGAGRPKGSKTRVTQELVLQATAQGITPVEVLLNDMRYFYNLGENKLRVAESTDAGKGQAKEFRAACALKEIARSCARDAAPYIHPRLASLQAKVEVTNVEAELAELE